MNTIMAKNALLQTCLSFQTWFTEKKIIHTYKCLIKACKLFLVAYCAQHLATGWSWLFQMLNASLVKTGFYCGDSETGREEERYRKQSIGAKGVSVFCFFVFVRVLVNVCCCLGKCVSCIVAPCPAFDLSLPKRFQTNRPSLPGNAGPAKPRGAVWVPPTHCSFLSLLL